MTIAYGGSGKASRNRRRVLASSIPMTRRSIVGCLKYDDPKVLSEIDSGICNFRTDKYRPPSIPRDTVDVCLPARPGEPSVGFTQSSQSGLGQIAIVRGIRQQRPNSHASFALLLPTRVPIRRVHLRTPAKQEVRPSLAGSWTTPVP